MPSKFTVHCIVVNEECFIEAVLRSVVSFADQVMVFDTGSTDATVEIIERVRREFPEKILFEEKGPCDRVRHTALRQEMIERTNTEWCLIVDGDEIWTKRGGEELLRLISQPNAECVIVPFYLCVGDIFHETRKEGAYHMLGKQGWFSPRAFKKTRGVHWAGDYDHDMLRDSENHVFFEVAEVLWMKERYWHVSHLTRSPLDDAAYSSGGTRGRKRRLTYTGIGRRIQEPVPEVFAKEHASRRMPLWISIKNLTILFVKRARRYVS